MIKTYTAPESTPGTPEISPSAMLAYRNRKTDANPNIVLYKPGEAKTKLAGARIGADVVSAILALESTKPQMMSALVDYACTDDVGKVIAERCALAPSALHYWAARVGLPMRQRGRRVQLEPTPAHFRILDLVRTHGIAGAARRARISRQRVHAIVCRWEPGLCGRRPKVRVLELHRVKRSPRNIVISFRISTDEWRRLLAAVPVGGEGETSGFAKARAIVLRYLSTPGDDESGPVSAIVSLAGGPANIVDVYDEKAA